MKVARVRIGFAWPPLRNSRAGPTWYESREGHGISASVSGDRLTPRVVALSSWDPRGRSASTWGLKVSLRAVALGPLQNRAVLVANENALALAA